MSLLLQHHTPQGPTNPMFVVGASTTNDGRIYTSPDGITWTNRGSQGTPTADRIGAIMDNGNGLFVLGTEGTSPQDIKTSPDGITWTSRGDLGSSTTALAFGNGLFVAGHINTSLLHTSPDGITWTNRGGPGYRANSAVFGNNLFVLGLDDGRIYTSPDGITWTLRTISATSADVDALAFGNGLFVAGYDDGRIYTSPDGITWTSRYFATGGIQGIAFGNGLFVANAGRRIFTSPDGITWTNLGEVLFSASTFTGRSIAFGNNKFVCISTNASSGYVETSNNGISWTTQSPIGESLECIHFGLVY